MKKIAVIILGFYIVIIPLNTCVGETFDTKTSPLLITEIMPNPKGADKEQEWIEIYNTTKQTASLSNWKLSNGKIFDIPEDLSILPESYFVLQGSNLKMTLKNNNTFLTLIDPLGNSVQEITYQKTTEDQSFSLINIKNLTDSKHSWTWSAPTKGSKNTTLYLLQGEISKSPEIGKDFYFEISVASKNIPIIFSEEKFNFDLLKNTLTQKSKGSFLIERISNKLNLINFKITKPANVENHESIASPLKTNSQNYWLLFPICLLTTILIYLSIKPSKTISLPS